MDVQHGTRRYFPPCIKMRFKMLSLIRPGLKIFLSPFEVCVFMMLVLLMSLIILCLSSLQWFIYS